MGTANRERRCIVTGDACDEGELVRFVVGPDGGVVPDIAVKLPGRGAWVRARRETVARAIKETAFARVFRCDVCVGEDLVPIVENLLARRCLDALGLARKGGEVVAGFEKVSTWLRSGRASVLVHARNGSARERQRLPRPAAAVASVTLFDDAELGLALGRESVVHAAVAAGGFANSFLQEASRLEGFRVFDDATLD